MPGPVREVEESTQTSQSTFVSRPNPVTGKMDWVLQEEDYDFVQEIARSGYGDMLHDTDRNVRYYKAIKAAVDLLKSQGKKVNVLDIGTGTGLLSMMAVRSGADTVTACEAFHPMAECAKKVMAANNMADKIKLIPKRSTEVLLGEDLPQRANLLVTELFDTELIGEGAISSYTDAHLRLMEADCVAVPTLGRMFVQAVECDSLRKFNCLQPLSLPGGTTLLVPESFRGCGGAPSLHDLQVDELADQLTQISEPSQVFSFDFSKRNALKMEEHCKLHLSSQVTGCIDAFVMWWDLQMDPQAQIWLSCAPKWARPKEDPVPWRDHWMQAAYYPASPLPVEKGQQFDVFCSHDEYSLWFDFTDTKNERPVCSCGLHVTFSRSRLGEMNNEQSIHTYITAFQKHITPSSTCLVISEGTLLPLIAASLGAKKVFYLDNNISTRRVVKKLLEENKMLDQVTVLEKDPETLTNADFENLQIDLVLAEPYCLAAQLPWEHIYFWYAMSAVQDYLSPQVLVLPKSMKVKAIGVEFRDLHKIRMPVGDCEGFDIGHFDNLIMSSSESADPEFEPQPLWEYPCQALTAPTVVTSLDFGTPVTDTDHVEHTADLVCNRPGSLNGVAVWTEFDFGGGLFVNHGVQDDDWRGEKVRWAMTSRQGVHLFQQPHTVNVVNSKFSVKSTFAPSTGEFSLSLGLENLS